MSEKLVIGICGRAGAGKDSLASYIQNHFSDRKVHINGFATAIKEMMSKLFLVPEDCFYDRKLKETPMPQLYEKTPREICQWFGTDVIRRDIDKRFWVNRLCSLIESTDCDIFVVPDVRFYNEYVDLRTRFKAKILYIDADRRLSVQSDSHVSELEHNQIKEFLPEECIIYNNDAVDAFDEECRKICDQLYAKN